MISSIETLSDQLIFELAQGIISGKYDELLTMPTEVLTQINKRLRTVPVSFWPDEIQQFGDFCALSLIEETNKKFQKCLKESSLESLVSSVVTPGFFPIPLQETSAKEPVPIVTPPKSNWPLTTLGKN